MCMPEGERNPDRMTCRRVAVLSDIHSNYYALKNCIDDAIREGADGFIFLGDYVSGLSEVTQTLDLVYRIRDTYPTVCLRGNRERYMLEEKCGSFPFTRGSNTGSYLFTHERLRPEDRAFFAALPCYERIQINGVDLELAHATKGDDRAYFYEQKPEILQVFPQMEAAYLITGHSHVQYSQAQGDKTIINPGSVGLPHGGDNRAKYALLQVSPEGVQWEFRAVSYDIRAVIHAQFASGLAAYAPCWAAGELYSVILGTGRTAGLLERISNLSKQDYSVWHNEKIWRQCLAEEGMALTEEEILAFYESTLI